MTEHSDWLNIQSFILFSCLELPLPEFGFTSTLFLQASPWESPELLTTNGDYSYSVNKQANNKFNIKPTGDSKPQLLLAACTKKTSQEVLLGNVNALHYAFY